MDTHERTAWRAEFDAEVEFTNGGGLQAQGFRLDIPGGGIDDTELGAMFVRHLGLLMVGAVRISNRHLLREAHKGSRGATASESRAADTTGVRRIVDLSHPISDGMVTYPGLPGPEIGEFLTREASRSHYAPGTEFSIGRISMVANSGTYLDSPYHRYADGADLAALPLKSAVDLDGLVVRVTGAGGRAVQRNALLAHEVRGRAVLVHTGWDRHWGTPRYGSGDHPYVSREAAAWLAEQGAALVGIDSLNIDNTDDAARPAHTTLPTYGTPRVSRKPWTPPSAHTHSCSR